MEILHIYILDINVEKPLTTCSSISKQFGEDALQVMFWLVTKMDDLPEFLTTRLYRLA